MSEPIDLPAGLSLNDCACGETATLMKSQDEDGYSNFFVLCEQCGRRGDVAGNKHVAVSLWNDDQQIEKAKP